MDGEENVGESGWIRYGELFPTGGHRDFAALEGLMPGLFAALRRDLAEHPHRREVRQTGDSPAVFRYGEDDQPGVAGRLEDLVTHGLLVGRGEGGAYELTEEFVQYLTRKPRPADDED
jgi:hypothetical protein